MSLGCTIWDTDPLLWNTKSCAPFYVSLNWRNLVKLRKYILNNYHFKIKNLQILEIISNLVLRCMKSSMTWNTVRNFENLPYSKAKFYLPCFLYQKWWHVIMILLIDKLKIFMPKSVRKSMITKFAYLLIDDPDSWTNEYLTFSDNPYTFIQNLVSKPGSNKNWVVWFILKLFSR